MKIWYACKVTYDNSSVRFSVDVDAVAAVVVAAVVVIDLVVCLVLLFCCSGICTEIVLCRY